MIQVENFGERKIAIKGVGKSYFQSGFPLSMAIKELSGQGIEVSMFHVVDELIRNGWSAKTILNKLKEELRDNIECVEINIPQIEKFLLCEYEQQREMIFNYLFKGDMESAKIFFKSHFKG